MKQIGNLFILRININLVGSILDSPVSTARCLDMISAKGCFRSSSGEMSLAGDYTI